MAAPPSRPDDSTAARRRKMGIRPESLRVDRKSKEDPDRTRPGRGWMIRSCSLVWKSGRKTAVAGLPPPSNPREPSQGRRRTTSPPTTNIPIPIFRTPPSPAIRGQAEPGKSRPSPPLARGCRKFPFGLARRCRRRCHLLSKVAWARDVRTRIAFGLRCAVFCPSSGGGF